MREVFQFNKDNLHIQVFKNEHQEFALIVADDEMRSRITIIMNQSEMLDFVIRLKHGLE